MWNCNFGIVKQLFYNRREYKESDHRPVVSYFVVEIKKVNQERKEETMRQVYEVILFVIFRELTFFLNRMIQMFNKQLFKKKKH